MSEVRVRLPSQLGFHIGSARTALFVALRKAYGWKICLRIENG